MTLAHLTTTSPQRRRLIVGCGYLGLRVAKRWLASGSQVWAATRSSDRANIFKDAGLLPIEMDVTKASLPELPSVDTVLWSVGFDRASGDSHYDIHVRGLSRFLDACPGTPRIVLCSSTGVWGDEDGRVVDESTPPHPTREAGRVLLEAEQLLNDHRLGPGIVLRFAGLYGPGRLPRIDQLRAGIPIPADPESWLNLIHIDDAANVIETLAERIHARKLYVVSDGTPVQRKMWYEKIALLTNSPPPRFDTEAPRTRGADKRVDARRLWSDLGRSPMHPDSFHAVSELSLNEP